MGKAGGIFGLLVCVSFILQVSASCYDGKHRVTFTKYWIPKEGSDDVDENDDIIHLRGPRTRSLRDETGKVLARVDKNTEYKCLLEGTCFVFGGKLLNVGVRDNVFEVVDTKRFPFGIGAHGNPIHPYSSVASNDLRPFTKLFVEALHNFRLPNGQVHNGCVRVDDTFSEHTGCHIDFFMPAFHDYFKVEKTLPDSTHVLERNCEILTYRPT